MSSKPFAFRLFTVCLLAFLASACLTEPNLKLVGSPPDIIKAYKHVSLMGGRHRMKDTGGRTISITGGLRARISDKFLDRISGGKGRIILTASGANKVSAEKPELEHGVFTHFLVQGLEGAADANRDGLITVDEIYNYVSIEVPRETGQEQHPVKKGTVEGRLVIGVVN